MIPHRFVKELEKLQKELAKEKAKSIALEEIIEKQNAIIEASEIAITDLEIKVMELSN